MSDDYESASTIGGGFSRRYPAGRHRSEPTSPAVRLRLLEAVLAHANDAVVITDPDSRIEYVNPAYTQISGYGADEVIGRKPSEFLHGPATDEETLARIRAAIDRQEPIRDEILNYRKDGRPFWVELNVVPLRDEEGELTHWASIQRDTTERRQLEEEKAELYADAQEATRLRDEVFRIVAHDLRNPLSVIEMAAQLLQESAPGEAASSTPQLQTIRSAVQQMDDLIQDLLDVARMQAGPLAIKPEAVEAGQLIDESIELHRALAAEKDLQLTAEVPTELPQIQADRGRLMQALQNLIGNAIKFTPPGGRITVGCRAARGELNFFVSDTGPGIAKEHLPHLFDAFWKADEDSRSGAGLGLAIGRGIAEAHGGRIWAESEPGQGSTFHFSIPTAGH
ncbi:MAG: PAS domain S-box protein [Gemmatimonas sp.]|nr:PAS domain S-box protein [Gemmatimonas sp.]